MSALDGPLVIGWTLTLAAVMWVTVAVYRWIVSGPHLDDDEPVIPRPRLSDEWSRLAEFQAQARADIALESGDFAAWEREVAS